MSNPQSNFRELLHANFFNAVKLWEKTRIPPSKIRQRISAEGRATPDERQAICAALNITEEQLIAALEETRRRPRRRDRGLKSLETAGAA